MTHTLRRHHQASDGLVAKVSQVSLFVSLVSSIALKMEPDKSLKTLGVLLIFTAAVPPLLAFLFLSGIDFGRILQVSEIKRLFRAVFEYTLGRWIDGCLQRTGEPSNASLDDLETAHRAKGTSLGRVLWWIFASSARKDRGKERAAEVERSSSFRANSCADRVGGVERFVTQSPHQRRHPNQQPSLGLDRVCTAISPPMRVQPRPSGDGANSSFVQSRLEQVPPLDASGAAASGRLLPACTATRAYLDAHAYLEDNQPL